jgi:hypothetical protein
VTTKKAQNIKIQPQKKAEDVTTKESTKYKNTPQNGAQKKAEDIA